MESRYTPIKHDSEQLIYERNSHNPIFWLDWCNIRLINKVLALLKNVDVLVRNPMNQQIHNLICRLQNTFDIEKKRSIQIQIGNIEHNSRLWNKLYGSEDDNQLTNMISYQRENSWMPTILAYTATTNAFICCGIRHMARILYILSMRGYYVSPVYETQPSV